MASNIKVTLELDNKQYIANINTAKERTESFAKSADEATAKASRNFSKIADSAGVALGKLKALAAAYVGIASIKSSIGFAAELDALSKATDVSIPKILALDAALAAAGGQSGKAGDFISELQKKLYEASLGSADAQESFLKLGFSFKEMGNLTPEQALQKTIIQLAGMEDSVRRNAIAQKLLGDAAKNIDWASVAQDYQKNADSNKEFAAAAAKSAAVMKDIQQAGQNLKIMLTTLIAPFLDLLKFIKELNDPNGGIGKFGSLIGTLTTGVLKSLALGLATIVTLFDNLVQGMSTLIEITPSVLTGNWSEATAIIKRNNESIATSWEKLFKFVNEQDLFGSQTSAEGQPTTPGGKGPGVNVSAYYAKEVEALKQLSRAYIDNDLQLQSNIRFEQKRIKEGEDAIAVMTELRNISLSYNKVLLDINNRIAQESAGPQTAATAAKIAQLKEERDIISKTYNDQLEKIPELIRLRQQEITMSKAVAEAANLSRDSYAGLLDKQAEISKIGASPLLKELIDIQVQADKTAASIIDIEAQRKFGQDYILKRESFFDPTTGAYLDKTMEEFRQKIQSVYQTKADIQKKDLEEVRAAQAEWGSGWQEAFTTYITNASNAAKEATTLFENFTKGFEDAIVNFVKTGKLSFRDLANTIIAEFARIQAKKMAVGILGGATNIFSSLFGGGSSPASQLAAGLIPMATGGIVTSPTPALVGEAGPEAVIPLSKLGDLGGSTSITYNINAVDAASFKSMVARDPEFLYAVTEQGRRSMPGRRARS